MSDTIIQAENIGKKYLITHQTHGNYTALRDVITEKARALTRRILTPLNSKEIGSSLEEFWALKNISFDVKQGECIGIIGPNGAGKTTLLKILSRITEPTTGRVKINGLVGSLLEVGTGFHPELTGRENIFLNGAILGMSKTEIKKKFDEIVSFAEVEKFLDTPVKRYSSGMYVRLAFAVAAHLEPEILVVDEVLAVGDIAFQKKCLGKMQDVGEKEGRTVLFVSHQMSAIRSLCQRTFWLDAGKIRKQGPSFEVVKEYETNFSKSSHKFSSSVTRSAENISNSSFYIQGVEMLNMKNERVNIFSYNDFITLIVTVSGHCISDKYSIEFRIYKLTGEFVSVGSSGTYHNIYFSNNNKKIRVDIGPLSLTNGTYSISLSLVTGMSRPDTWENACSFDIVNCHPFPTGRDVDKNSVCVLQQSFTAID